MQFGWDTPTAMPMVFLVLVPFAIEQRGSMLATVASGLHELIKYHAFLLLAGCTVATSEQFEVLLVNSTHLVITHMSHVPPPALGNGCCVTKASVAMVTKTARMPARRT